MGYFDSPCKMYHLILTPKRAIEFGIFVTIITVTFYLSI